MNNINVDAAKLAAMPLEELEKLAAPVMDALRTKRETQSKEERLRRRREYDRVRNETTVAVSIRVDDKESAAAVRGLVRQLKALSKLNGRTVAQEVAAAVKRMPAGRRKARPNSTEPTRGGGQAKSAAPANVIQEAGHVDER